MQRCYRFLRAVNTSPFTRCNHICIPSAAAASQRCNLHRSVSTNRSGVNLDFDSNRKHFENFLPTVKSFLTKSIPEVPAGVAEALGPRLSMAIEYNLKGGKRNRGLWVLETYQLLTQKTTIAALSDNELRCLFAVGWAVEMMQAFLLVADDIMDNSKVRRGQPCWYTKGEIGLSAINDVNYMYACIFKLLQQFTGSEPYFPDIQQLFHEMIYKTVLGQYLDLVTAAETGFDKFTEEKYKAIVELKTSYYSFYLPVALGLHMAGVETRESFEVAEDILLKIGYHFQVQDDYLDCFGDSKVTGKTGTDIQDNKCSWFIVHALKTASDEQKEIISKNYGSMDNDKVTKIKSLYEEMKLRAKYDSFEKDHDSLLKELIHSKDRLLPTAVSLNILDTICKRIK